MVRKVIVIFLMVSAVFLNFIFAAGPGREDRKIPPQMMMGQGQGMPMMGGGGNKGGFHNEMECQFCMNIQILIRHSEKFVLNEEQLNKIVELEKDCKKNQIKKQAEIDVLEVDKQSLFQKDELDLNAIKDIIQKSSILVGEKEFICVETFKKAKELLNDEQKKKFQEIIKMNSRMMMQRMPSMMKDMMEQKMKKNENEEKPNNPAPDEWHKGKEQEKH